LVVSGWDQGQAGEPLGHAEVAPGISEDLALLVDPLQATSTLVATLHKDAGEIGKFEFPGPDGPIQVASGAITAEFAITPTFVLPSLSVANQVLGEDGEIIITDVYSSGPGWIQIHATDAGEMGPAVGLARLEAGTNDNVRIRIQARQATPELVAALYHDKGEPNHLDETDLVVLVRGEPVIAPFEVTLPTDIHVIDQPVVNGELVIERVVTSGPAWLVIYRDNEGDIDRIIGFAPLREGINELLRVEVVEQAVTNDLHILLHEDTVPGDEFDFPAADGPIRLDGRLPEPFTFRTNPGNYLVTRDQQLGVALEGDSPIVFVPLVVVDVPAWVIIRTDQDGEPGEMIGSTRVPPGVHSDVLVTINIDAGTVTETVYAALHLDAGAPETLEFPEGPDVPLRYGGSEIRSPFLILPSATE
jgi:hypothetical protein